MKPDYENITVTDSTIEGQITTLLRYMLTAGGSFALGKGYVTEETMQFLTAFLTIVLPTAWGIYKTYTSKKKQIAMAPSSDVATLVTK